MQKYNNPYIQVFNTHKIQRNKPHIYGAGILPFQINENNLYFLLGQDKDGSWSDFGGRVDFRDKNIKETAVREFYEETIGVVLDIDTITSMLNSNKHYVLVESKTLNGSPYYMYLVRVPYNHYRNEFKKFYKFLKHINTYDKYMEKIDIRWYSKDSLLMSLKNDDHIPLRKVFKNTILKHVDTVSNIHKHL